MNSAPDTAPSSPSPIAEDGAYAVLGRLRTLARIAGLHLPLPYPDDATGDRLLLGEVSEATVRHLTALLAEPGTPPVPVPDAPGIDGAARCLRAAAREASIDLPVQQPQVGPDGLVRLPLGGVGSATASRLADIVERHLSAQFAVEAALQAALSAIGVRAGQLSADGGVITIGEITVPEALVLLHRLTPDQPPSDFDPDDSQAGVDLADRLTRAIEKVTDGGFLNAAYTPHCRRCHGQPAILLGTLTPPHARTLARYVSGTTG